MARRARRTLCHDCGIVLVADDRLHYVYQCHACAIGEHDLILPAGEAAEFDTRVPHWFGRCDEHAVEFLSIFGPQGERIHVRARSKN